MISSLCARIKQLGGSPDQAAAQMLFGLAVEEDFHLENNSAQLDSTFETPVREHASRDPVKIHELGKKQDCADERVPEGFTTMRE